MYGLKQVAILAYDNLKEKLQPFGYAPVTGTVGIRQQETRSNPFCLCIDDFGIKYNTKQDAQHLLDAIDTNYKYPWDWTGSTYCGLTLEWNYGHGYIDISMPSYGKKTSIRLNHTPKIYRQYSPHPHVLIVYTTKNTTIYNCTIYISIAKPKRYQIYPIRHR